MHRYSRPWPVYRGIVLLLPVASTGPQPPLRTPKFSLSAYQLLTQSRSGLQPNPRRTVQYLSLPSTPRACSGLASLVVPPVATACPESILYKYLHISLLLLLDLLLNAPCRLHTSSSGRSGRPYGHRQPAQPPTFSSGTAVRDLEPLGLFAIPFNHNTPPTREGERDQEAEGAGARGSA